MVQYLRLALGLLLAYIVYSVVRTFVLLRQSIAAAKASGLTYKVVPVFWLRRAWLILNPLLLPLLARLPRAWTEWVDFCLAECSFDYGHEIFERIGADTFLTVSPGKHSLWTADPAVIVQITTRRNDFPKPTRIYRSLDIYGKNVVSTEGTEWRYHRKATSPPFTEKNNHIVWSESIAQAKAMLESWVGADGKGDKTVDRIMDDTMRLALHVISKAGFGRPLDWPTAQSVSTVDEGYVDPSKIENTISEEEVKKGHTMSYSYAIHCLLDNILLQFLVPRWMLKNLPVKVFQKANEAYIEWGKYMRDMVATKKASVTSGAAVTDNDILGQLVKGQVAQAKEEKTGEKKNTTTLALSDEHILGNSFVLILAGHETAANSMHFAILYLAMFIPSQRRLQKDLDEIFQGKPPSEWDYDRDLPALFGGMAGAILNEELRLVPPVVNIPKRVTTDRDQPLKVDGKDCVIPKSTYVSLCTPAVQRNPKYWTYGKPRNPGGKPVHPKCNVDNDLDEFRPERWLLQSESNVDGTGAANGNTGKKEVKMVKEQLDNEGLSVNLSSDTSDHLFRPVKGSYVPFSEGYRACLGRRFAQVEVLVTLAVLFQNYSVELSVDEYASDVEIEAMDLDARSEVWGKAANRCRLLMRDGMGVIITLQMRKGTVAVRFVPRGKERFPEDADERDRDVRRKKGEKNVLKVGEVAKKVEGWRKWDKSTWT